MTVALARDTRVQDDHVSDPLDSIDGPAGFTRVREAGIDGVIWRRALPAPVQRWLDGAPADELPAARLVLPVREVKTAVADLVRPAGPISAASGDGPRAWFVDDVTTLATAFAGAMEVAFVRLRFDVVHDDACRKFHLDAVPARLICTYRGCGTEYGLAGANEDPAQVFTAPTGAPLILRGSLGRSRTARCVRHRSPPIARSSAARLLLALDPLAEPTGEASDDPAAG